MSASASASASPSTLGKPACRRVRRAALLSTRGDTDLRFDVWRRETGGTWALAWELRTRRARAASFAAELTRKYGELHVALPAGRRTLPSLHVGTKLEERGGPLRRQGETFGNA